MPSSPRDESAAGDRTPDSYQTIARAADAEFRQQRSRFIARVAPAGDQMQARELVACMAGEHHDCRHVCFAWRGGHGKSIREIRHDAGEPSGTAGLPILTALRQAGVTHTVAVVARYFGGIKLGTGPLARAYAQATSAALQQAVVRTVRLGAEFQLGLTYAQQKTVAHLLQLHDGKIIHESYADQVIWDVWLPRASWQAWADELVAATAGSLKAIAPVREGPEPF